MTAEAALVFLAGVNPGFILMAAGLLAAFVTGSTLRACVLAGGPVAALVAMLFSTEWGASLASVEAFGLVLSIYRVDSLSFLFALAFIFAAILNGIYSLHRVDRVEDASGLVLAGGAVGAVLCGDLATLFLFWEVTAISSTLIVMGRRTREARAAGVRYLIFQVVSGLLLLGGVAQLAAVTGTTSFEKLAQVGFQPLVGVLDPALPGAQLILAAFGIKAAFPVVHNWLQDAYPRATETGSVILSAFTTKLAVYALARCFAGLDMLIWIGAVMTVFPVFFAVIENDLRKVLSYSLNNQVGFMVCAIGVGGQMAINGAAAHAFVHIIYKSLLFMTMGAVLLRTGTTKASELGGLHRTMPYTTLFCMVGAASISALPFFSGFPAKSMEMSAVQGEHLDFIWLMLLFASAGVLEHSGIKVPFFAFFGHDSGKRPQEAPFNMLMAMGLAAGLCIAIGVSPEWLYSLLPYPEAARAYLLRSLWTPQHLITQFELLLFAGLAFVILRDRHLYPTERPGLIMDTEWLWRRAGPSAVKAAAGVGKWIGNLGEAALGRLARLIERGALAILAPGGTVSRHMPLAATAVWTAGVLAFVMIIIMGASN